MSGEGPCNLLLCSPNRGKGRAGSWGGRFRVGDAEGGSGWGGVGCSGVVSVCDRDCVPVTVQHPVVMGWGHLPTGPLPNYSSCPAPLPVPPTPPQQFQSHPSTPLFLPARAFRGHKVAGSISRPPALGGQGGSGVGPVLSPSNNPLLGRLCQWFPVFIIFFFSPAEIF